MLTRLFWSHRIGSLSVQMDTRSCGSAPEKLKQGRTLLLQTPGPLAICSSFQSWRSVLLTIKYMEILWSLSYIRYCNLSTVLLKVRNGILLNPVWSNKGYFVGSSGLTCRVRHQWSSIKCYSDDCSLALELLDVRYVFFYLIRLRDLSACATRELLLLQEVRLVNRVPRGSCLGPLLFTV